MCRRQVGEGEGITYLLLNVSGQNTLALLPYAPPSLASLTPATFTTEGGASLTLTGSNFGLGDSFAIAFSGGSTTAGTAGHCNYLIPSGSVTSHSPTSVTFNSPVGQCDGPMAVTLTVAGQPSNARTATFLPPAITMLSFDGVHPLGSNCDRRGASGCGLSTAGGYTVTVTGNNFGLDTRTVLFNGAALAASQFTVTSQTSATFVVPPGSGAANTVQVRPPHLAVAVPTSPPRPRRVPRPP